MLRLSLEIPTDFLPWWSPLVDFDFTLAHQVLQNTTYARFFRERPASREVLMDNSMHELGAALPAADLQRAADLCHATYVIAPDKLGEPALNERWFHETRASISSTYSIGVVMSGRTPEERRSYLKSVAPAGMLLLPYRENRLAWFKEQESLILSTWKRIHLLGVNELPELTDWVRISKQHPVVDWSVDTAKPIKHGIARRRIDDGKSLRGAALSSADLLNHRDIDGEQAEYVEGNIKLLRRICAG